jgi:hypothetical protein
VTRATSFDLGAGGKVNDKPWFCRDVADGQDSRCVGRDGEQSDATIFDLAPPDHTARDFDALFGDVARVRIDKGEVPASGQFLFDGDRGGQGSVHCAS